MSCFFFFKSRRLKAQSPMTGTLRAALVPYGEDDALFADSVGILDEYSGSYPTEGSLQASWGRVKMYSIFLVAVVVWP